MTFSDALRLEYIDGRKWLLTDSFHYKPLTGDPIAVPAGFITDFASIPRAFWAILPPTGQYGKAAVIHDYLYNHPGSRTRGECDAIFREAMQDLGVPERRVELLYLGVRSGGWAAWRGYRKAET